MKLDDIGAALYLISFPIFIIGLILFIIQIIKKKKKKVSISLIIISIILLVSGVFLPGFDELAELSSSTKSNFNGEKISVEEAEKIAKQEIVNLCCDNSYVSSVKITYGTFNYSDYYKGGYEFEAQGTYLPIDSYGMYGDMQKFNIRLTVENDGKATVVVESFSPAY